MPRKQLIGFGSCFGKFTKTKKFRLHVTCLDYVAQHAQHKVWLKPSAEQSFLYGNNVLKAVRRAVSCPPPSERRPERWRRRLRRAWAGSQRTRRSTRASLCSTWLTCRGPPDAAASRDAADAEAAVVQGAARELREQQVREMFNALDQVNNVHPSHYSNGRLLYLICCAMYMKSKAQLGNGWLLP